MPYVAARTSIGFEFMYNKAGFSSNPVAYKLTPDTAYSKGQLMVYNPATGCAASAAGATQGMVLGPMAHSVAQADNPADEDTFGKIMDNPLNVYKVSFTNHLDVAASAAGSTTTFVSDGNLHAGLAGALIFITRGPAAGAIRTISACDDDTATVAYPFPVAPGADARAVVLGEDDANGAINKGSRGLIVRDGGLLVDAGAAPADTGILTVVGLDVRNLMLEVMIMASKHVTG